MHVWKYHSKVLRCSNNVLVVQLQLAWPGHTQQNLSMAVAPFCGCFCSVPGNFEGSDARFQNFAPASFWHSAPTAQAPMLHLKPVAVSSSLALRSKNARQSIADIIGGALLEMTCSPPCKWQPVHVYWSQPQSGNYLHSNQLVSAHIFVFWVGKDNLH